MFMLRIPGRKLPTGRPGMQPHDSHVTYLTSHSISAKSTRRQQDLHWPKGTNVGSLARTNSSSNMSFMLNRRPNHLLKDTCRSTLAHPEQPNHPSTKKAPTPSSEQADGGRGCACLWGYFKGSGDASSRRRRLEEALQPSQSG
jgi:hypothetical protein